MSDLSQLFGSGNEDLVLIGSYAAAWLFMGIIGWAIGKTKGRSSFGLVLGLLVGPIGWLIVMLLPAEGRKCPFCLSTVPEGAVICRHCRCDLPMRTIPTLR